MKHDRILQKRLTQHFSKSRQVLVLLGPRQVGKTTLIKRAFPSAKYFLLDDETVKSVFETYSLDTYKKLIKNQKQIILDEIQALSNPGRCAKLIYDLLPKVQLIITGSSSFHIKNKTSESLAGRKVEYTLYPLTFSEYLYQTGQNSSLDSKVYENILKSSFLLKDAGDITLYNSDVILNQVLVYGLYPQIINSPMNSDYLFELADSVIFKDLIDMNLIENRSLAQNLLKLLAHQIGNIVNYSEIAQVLGADQRTIKRYIEIFEQSYILYRLYPFSTNKRKEVSKSPKVYFYDTGLRNAVIRNFAEISLRPDKGALFENFIINEVVKSNSYLHAHMEIGYWRNKNKAEVDLVLRDPYQKLYGVEIKFNNTTFSVAFKHKYPDAITSVVTKDNFNM